jgi:bacteriocin biosynthesis cyclodehydratase domain-containing protein
MSQLPAVLRPRPHHPLLRRTGTSVQFGLVDRVVELAELTAPLWHLTQRLPERAHWPVTELITVGAELGAAAPEVHELLAELYAAGVLLDAERHDRLEVARRGAGVLVEGAGPLLAEVATGLAEAGVGWIGVRADAVGWPDEVAAAEAALRRAAPATRLIGANRRVNPDLVVLTGTLAPDRARLAQLHADGTPTLLVRLVDGLGLIGPLILPGRTACAGCLERHHIERDRYWPGVGDGLAGVVGTASRASMRASAALGVEQAVRWLDALVQPVEPPPTLDTVLELDPARGELRRRRWSAHPDCPCGATDTSAADTSATDTGSTWITGRVTGDAPPGGRPPAAPRLTGGESYCE